MTCRLIGSELTDRPSDQVRAKVVCCKTLTTLSPDQWLLNHQDPVVAPYGSPPTANRWPHWGRVPLCRSAVGVFYCPSRQDIFNGISTFVGYLMPNLVLFRIHDSIYNHKLVEIIFIKCMCINKLKIILFIVSLEVVDWFGLAWFYGKSTITGYLILNFIYTYLPSRLGL